jgi:hypothetical protein
LCIFFFRCEKNYSNLSKNIPTCVTCTSNEAALLLLLLPKDKSCPTLAAAAAQFTTAALQGLSEVNA